jgi:hypothetical protein
VEVIVNTPLFPGDKEQAAPYRGRTLRVRRVNLNDIPEDLRGRSVQGSFGLHPALDVNAIDQDGRLVESGTLVIVLGGGAKTKTT